MYSILAVLTLFKTNQRHFIIFETHGDYKRKVENSRYMGMREKSGSKNGNRIRLIHSVAFCREFCWSIELVNQLSASAFNPSKTCDLWMCQSSLEQATWWLVSWSWWTPIVFWLVASQLTPIPRARPFHDLTFQVLTSKHPITCLQSL